MRNVEQSHGVPVWVYSSVLWSPRAAVEEVSSGENDRKES